MSEISSILKCADGMPADALLFADDSLLTLSRCLALPLIPFHSHQAVNNNHH
jgi:hypothetical protein